MTDRTKRRTALLLILLCIALGVLLFLAIRHTRKPLETREEQPAPAPAAADTTRSPPLTPEPAIVTPDTLPVPVSRRSPVPNPPSVRPLRPDTLRAEMGVNEFIRDFYGDVKERTVTVLLTESRLDTIAPGRWMFRRGLTGGEISPVKLFSVAVDSVRPLRTYIFPGWGYGSDWAPLPDGSIGLEGRIEPKRGTYILAPAPGRDQISGAVERKNDRLSIRLRSLPGYSYSIRFGVEYAATSAQDSAGTVFTHAEAVEFPLVIRCGSLAQEVADTVYIATSDPGAIHEVAATVPNAPVVAVLLDADPDAEWTGKNLTARPDVSIFFNSITASGESFVVLNGSKAFVERRMPDPAFDRIIRTHLGSGLRAGSLIEDDPARPVLRRTELLSAPEAVTALMKLFRQYVRESNRHY